MTTKKKKAKKSTTKKSPKTVASKSKAAKAVAKKVTKPVAKKTVKKVAKKATKKPIKKEAKKIVKKATVVKTPAKKVVAKKTKAVAKKATISKSTSSMRKKATVSKKPVKEEAKVASKNKPLKKEKIVTPQKSEQLPETTKPVIREDHQNFPSIVEQLVSKKLDLSLEMDLDTTLPSRRVNPKRRANSAKSIEEKSSSPKKKKDTLKGTPPHQEHEEEKKQEIADKSKENRPLSDDEKKGDPMLLRESSMYEDFDEDQDDKDLDKDLESEKIKFDEEEDLNLDLDIEREENARDPESIQKKEIRDLGEKIVDEIETLREDYDINEIRAAIRDLDIFNQRDSDDCLEKYCENIHQIAGHCRLHYIKNWVSIKRKETILKEGKLQFLIEELINKYPIKHIESIMNDLSSDKQFYEILKDLHIDGPGSEENSDDGGDDDDIEIDTKSFGAGSRGGNFDEEDSI